MTSETTKRIKSYSTDVEGSNALLCLLDYYGKDNLMCISEEMALDYLAKLESGEIVMPERGRLG